MDFAAPPPISPRPLHGLTPGGSYASNFITRKKFLEDFNALNDAKDDELKSSFVNVYLKRG